MKFDRQKILAGSGSEFTISKNEKISMQKRAKISTTITQENQGESLSQLCINKKLSQKSKRA